MCPGGPYPNPPGHIFYAGNFQKNQQGNRKQFPLLAFLICLHHFSFTVMSVLFFCFHTKNGDVRPDSSNLSHIRYRYSTRTQQHFLQNRCTPDDQSLLRPQYKTESSPAHPQ